MSTVAKEVAEAEFNRFLESMDLEADPSIMDADDTKAFEDAKRKLVQAIERGTLAVDEKGQPIYTPQVGELGPITFYEPTGASFIAMDGKKKEQQMAKMFAVMADMTHKPAATFSKMAMRDFKICQTLVTLFLG